jgi:hypothetical protein
VVRRRRASRKLPFMADSPFEGQPRDYFVFGLRVRSSLPLPELFPASAAGEPDVLVELGDIAETNRDPGLTTTREGLLLTIPDVGRYLISGGRSIRAEPMSGVDARNVRLFLLGSAFGALLHQRGLLPLHANAIEVDGKAVAFMGRSGAGKSTLAAWFHDRDYRILADDVCVVCFEGDQPFVVPGLPRLRLWLDALEASGRRAENHVRSAMLDEIRDKFDLPIGSGQASQAPVPLAALYLLDRDRRLSITRMVGIEAADAIFANTYRGAFVGTAGSAPTHFRTSTQLLNAAPIYHVRREWSLERMAEQNRRILDHIVTQGSMGSHQLAPVARRRKCPADKPRNKSSR